ncbi:GumC family protein [Phormidesmis sp. 146-33]
MNPTYLTKPTAETDPGYGQILTVLWRRRFLFASIFTIVLGVSAYYASRQTTSYASSMQLLVEPYYKGKAEKTTDFADSNVEIDPATQISLLQSSALLQKAMKSLQTDYPELDANNPSSVLSLKSGLTIGLGGTDTKVGSDKGTTKIFQISYTDTDPAKTQRVLKALKQVYLDYNLEQQRLRLGRGLSFINEQLPQIRDKMKRSETALEDFRREQELIDPEGEAKTQAALLQQIQQEKQSSLIKIRELRSRYSTLQQQLALAPQEATLSARLSQSSRYQNLLVEVQKNDLALVQQRLRFKDTTPFVQQLVDQRQRLLGLLREEAGRILGTDLVSRTDESLLTKGQLNTLDLGLVGQLATAQVELQAAVARYSSLLSTEQQVREALKRFPKLLAAYGRLQPEVELNRETLRELLKARQELGLEIARGGFDWQVVEEPQLGFPSGSNLSRNVLVGVVAGLFLGGIAAFARDAADSAVRSSDELEKQSPVPLLGVIPELAAQEGLNPTMLSLPFRKTRELPPSLNQILQERSMRESLDLLYQNIQLLTKGQPLNSLVVTSALAGEGKSTLIMGLAISAARLHQRVLLIDADLRRPSLHQILNLPNDQGLSTLLTSNAPLPQDIDTQQNSSLRGNIAVLTSGPIPSDPAKLLSSRRMREVVAKFEQSYDLVLLDVPPVLGMVDTILAASCCGGVILVGRMGRVTRDEVTQAIAALSSLNLVGVVANGSTQVATIDTLYQAQAS